MPPLAAQALRGALDPANRVPTSGPSLLNRLSPAPGTIQGTGGSPSRIPVAPGGGGGRGGHQRTNGISVRGAAVPGNRGGMKKKYVRNEKMELAVRAADDFITIFYTNMDVSTRPETLTNLYRPSSTFVWNGNKIQGVEAIKDFLSKLPPSRHEIQSYDSHAIPGTDGGNRKPSLFLTVSGTVVHGKDAIDNPPSKAYEVADALPRMFSQTFVLSPDLEGSGATPEQWPLVDKYFILSDHMRFVG